MKFLETLILASLLSSEASQMSENASPKRKPGGCYSEVLKIHFSGVKNDLGNICIQASCNEDGSIDYTMCGTSEEATVGFVDEKCRVVKNLELPFPKCCVGVIICDLKIYK